MMDNDTLTMDRHLEMPMMPTDEITEADLRHRPLNETGPVVVDCVCETGGGVYGKLIDV